MNEVRRPKGYCNLMKEFNADNGGINEGFEYKEASFSLNGCCRGGCFVISLVEFCPFCGTKMEPQECPVTSVVG